MAQEGEPRATAPCGAAVAPNEAKDEAPLTGRIRVSFKVSGGTQFTLDVDEQWTVKALKERCEEKANIPVSAQRLIYKGRILKDGDLISSQGVKDGHIMHLVKSAAAASGTTPATAATASSQGNAPAPERTPQAAPSVGGAASGTMPTSGGVGGASMESLLQSMLSGGMGGMDGLPAGFGGLPQVGGPEMAQMLQSPSFQQALDSLIQNPQMLRSIMEGVPALRPMMPMIQVLLEDPERLRAFFNPQMAQASLQMQQAMQQMRQNSAAPGTQQTSQVDGASPLGAEAPAGIPPAILAAMRNMHAGNLSQAANNVPSGTPSTTGIPPGNGLFGSPGPAGADFASMMQRASQMMQQNPELVNQMMQTMMSGGNNPMAGMGAFGFPTPDSRPPEERFSSQLQALTDMGFIDRDANIAALQETNGDVNAAITRLLERGLGN